MAIQNINPEKCIGCRKCVESCAADVIAFDAERKKAYVRYSQECVLCCWCLVECPVGAITMVTGRELPFGTTFG